MEKTITQFLDRNPDLLSSWQKGTTPQASRLIIRFLNSENKRDKELTRILKNIKHLPYLGYVIYPVRNAFFYLIYPWIYKPF